MSFDSPVPLTKADLPLQPERPTNARFGTLSWLCMAATIAYVCRNSFGPLESTIRKDLQIDETTMGYIISSFSCEPMARYLTTLGSLKRELNYDAVC